jgi:hypothetical protein
VRFLCSDLKIRRVGGQHAAGRLARLAGIDFGLVCWRSKKKPGKSLIVVCLFVMPVCNANRHALTLSLQRDSDYLICVR